jgi:chitodextrinase
MARSLNTSHPLYGNLIAVIGVEDDGVTLKDFLTPSRVLTPLTSSPNGATFGSGTYGSHFQTGGTYDNSRGATISPAITLPGGSASIFVVHNGVTTTGTDSNGVSRDCFFIGRGAGYDGIDGGLHIYSVVSAGNVVGAGHSLVGGGGVYGANGTTPFIGGTARSLCATRDNASTRRLRIYCDGVQEAENPSVGSPGSANISLDKIGGANPGLIGRLDANIVWIAVFNKELSASEITSLHSSLGSSNTFGLFSASLPTITGPSGSAGAPSISHSVNENQNNAGTWSATSGSSWSLTGTDASLLSISSGGVVTLASGNFDRETKSSYSFNVLIDTVSQAVTLTINNVNEAPTFSGTITVPTLTVGATMTPVDFSSMFTDVDSGDSATYTTVGTWPAGVAISGTSISGTPSVAGTYSNLRVRRTDSGALTADSNLFTITVNASGDTTNPVLTGVVTPSSVVSAGATISWPAGSDNVAVTGYEYRLNGGSYTSVGNVLTTSLSGLTPSTAYTVDVRAFDAAGNRSTAITGNFTTSAASDTTPPTLTGSITVGTVTASSVQISWPAGSDNVAVASYEVSSNGGTSYSNVGNVLTFTFTGLSPSTSYSFRVRARDAAGNVSSALSVTQSTNAGSSVVLKRIVVVLTTNGTAPAASLVNLKWAFFDENRPDLFNGPSCQGATEITDLSGVLEIDVTDSSLAIGQTGWLIITDSDGTVFQNPPAKAFSAPVQVIAAS